MPPPPHPDLDIRAMGPMAAGAILMARNEQAPTNAGAGGIDPADINNKAIFAIFGVIGAAFVFIGIWFFFWAKNGGFYFKEDDWDDYKSTVLRRKGPNGTLLSGATATTRLGGGSVYKDVDENDHQDDDAATTVSGLTGITGITPGASDIGGREHHRKRKEIREEKRRAKQFEKERRKVAKKIGRHVGEDGVLVDEEAEEEAKKHLRNYRHEHAARVGGLNIESEGSTWDGSTNPSDSVVSSDLLSNQQPTPTKETPKGSKQKKTASQSEVSGTTGCYTEATGTTNSMTEVTDWASQSPTKTPTKPPRAAGGIRKVYSTADRNNAREQERVRAEARRLQEKGRAASSRDFSYQRADLPKLEAPPGSAMTPVTEESQSMLGSETQGSRVHWQDQDDNDGLASEVGTEIGTKTYAHPIPELATSSVSGGPGSASGAGSSTVSSSYVDERRKQRRAERGERGDRSSGYKREKRRV
ncbi:hypothetical protein MKZ38_004846 [Zalerion maritima]|uniref:Endosomal spry domain-containing protein n=1 Tax=Zalerion maritima TaxID=339359 RepID=A0AAD5RKZ8_9PEZI|nr:hypothetical protein MKZ38_004846 [Zalerion maritima]